MPTRRLALLVPVALLAASGPGARGAAQVAPADVYVIGTLYNRHATTPVFDLAALGRIIRAVDPDVMVLDVSPAELASRQVSAGKIEYPGVIFPYLAEVQRPSYAGEPDEPEYARIVAIATSLRRGLRDRDSSGAAALRQFRAAVYDSLMRAWRTPADVQSMATEQVIRRLKAHDVQVLGPDEETSGARWDHHAAGMVRQAAREHPGRRILQLTGLENLPNIRAELRLAPDLRLIDMEVWLRSLPAGPR